MFHLIDAKEGSKAIRTVKARQSPSGVVQLSRTVVVFITEWLDSCRCELSIIECPFLFVEKKRLKMVKEFMPMYRSL